VLGEDQVPVEPVERFLAFLSAIERSPNTIKAYAHDLKDWFAFLAGRGLDWRSVTVEDVAGFVAWLRLPPAARDGRVAVLPTVGHHCAAASVNRVAIQQGAAVGGSQAPVVNSWVRTSKLSRPHLVAVDR
jgi:hypothetical protein